VLKLRFPLLLSALLFLRGSPTLAAMITGVGIPTTDTPGGDPVWGTVTWLDSEQANYAVRWGATDHAGVLVLQTATTVGDVTTGIWGDPAAGLLLAAVSADGPVVWDPASWPRPGHGGFETWLLIDTSAKPNHYASLVTLTVPEPRHAVAWVGFWVGFLVLALCWLFRP